MLYCTHARTHTHIYIYIYTVCIVLVMCTPYMLYCFCIMENIKKCNSNEGLGTYKNDWWCQPTYTDGHAVR